MSGVSGKKLREALAGLSSAQACEAESGQSTLAAALRDQDARVVLEAAKLIAQHTLQGHEDGLVEAYRRFAGERAANDAGCLTKEALLAALDALEHRDAELFAQASLYVQLERAKNSSRDTAGRVRSRAVLALARLGHRDLWLLLGGALGDADPSVRLAAARAVAHRGQRDGAGLLLVRLGAGDSEADVFSECLKALFVVAPDSAKPRARALLEQANDARREHLLHALGTAPDDGAVELLLEALAKQPLERGRREVVEALGLSLRPLARASLLELVQAGRRGDAEAALTALSIHRYDERLCEQLERATARDRELAARFHELYSQ